MINLTKYSLAVLLIFLALSSGAARAALPVVMEEKNVLPYLEKVIAWHRAAAALEVSPELPREQIFKNALQKHTAKTLEDSFAFARTLAGMLPIIPKPAVTEETAEKISKGSATRRAVAVAEQRIRNLQGDLAHARTKAKREKLTGELKLAEEYLNVIKAVAQTFGASDEDKETETLAAKIDQLAGTAAEMDSEQQKAAATEATAAQPAAAPSGSGIMGLATRIYVFFQAKAKVKSLLHDTRILSDENKERSQLVRDSLSKIMQQGNNLGQAVYGPTLATPQPTYDDLLSDMKKLSKLAVALSQVNESILLCTRDLSSWAGLLSAHTKELLRSLIFRSSMLGLAIAMAVGLSMLARQATRRYVVDGRRRNQLRMVRKFTLAILIAIILFLGFFTDLGSLATFAGLLTAGIAFALHNMILSVIAYFQFFSGSDIKPGDRVTISTVTGKITHVGMLRFYVMELEKSDLGFLPTGRVVSFPNSIMFQPLPFYRQPPGTNFVWDQIDITLAPSAKHESAYKKLVEITQKVYAKHREVMRRHETAMQKMTHFKTEFSAPQTSLKLTNTGVVFIIRYAVDRDQEQAIRLNMIDEILTAIKKDPELKITHVD